jgi:hypothetical protein
MILTVFLDSTHTSISFILHVSSLFLGSRKPQNLVFGQQFPHILDLVPRQTQLSGFLKQSPHILDLAPSPTQLLVF